MVSKTYPIWIKFIVPSKDTFKFEQKVKNICSDNGIKKDVISLSHYAEDNREEVEYYIVLDVSTQSNSDAVQTNKQYLKIIKQFFESSLKVYYPKYSEEPTLRK